MNQFTSLLDHVPWLMFVAFRIGGLTIYGPVFGSSAIPVRIKVLFSMIVALAIYPVVQAGPYAGDLPALTLWTVAGLVAMELLVGLTIGYLASMPLMAVQTGGLVMGQQMGLGFARFYNPAVDDEADVIGQIFFFMALAGFLMIGGHEMMLLGVMRSFDHLPLGAIGVDLDLLELLIGTLTAALELALRVALPLLSLIFLESVAMGFISKTVPQLNIMSLGFPLRILLGTLIIILSLVVINEVVMEFIDWILIVIFEWIESH